MLIRKDLLFNIAYIQFENFHRRRCCVPLTPSAGHGASPIRITELLPDEQCIEEIDINSFAILLWEFRL